MLARHLRLGVILKASLTPTMTMEMSCSKGASGTSSRAVKLAVAPVRAETVHATVQPRRSARMAAS
jgi:hypothetical protein